MKALLKNWLLLIDSKCFLYLKQKALLCFLFFALISKSQITNYVSDGGFELLNSYSLTTLFNVVKYWQPIDTLKSSNYLVSTDPAINNAPYFFGYQYPRNGKNYVISSFLCLNCFGGNFREYLRNRLKQPLQSGKTYCVKYHVVNTNNSPLGIDKYGVYFGDSSLDTINYCNKPLHYITPHIENTSGIITDTLNWVSLTGTFVATGNEKYMVLGDFRTDAMTNTLLINPTFSATLVNDVCIDDVSVIDIDLPAYAGPDIWGIPSNTVYIGRPQDVGIDEACMWYHLPNTTTAIDTAAGITLTVGIVTNTYVVRQDICGNVKWDTVVIYPSGTGIANSSLIGNGIKIYPNPASDLLNIEFNLEQENNFTTIFIYNALGQLIREEEIAVNNKTALIKTNDLSTGVYHLVLSCRGTRDRGSDSSLRRNDNSETVSKRFTISR